MFGPILFGDDHHTKANSIVCVFDSSMIWNCYNLLKQGTIDKHNIEIMINNNTYKNWKVTNFENHHILFY